jgi:hypothetical protein
MKKLEWPKYRMSVYGENIDLSSYKNTSELQNGRLAFEHPMRVGILGRSGTGKTSMLLGMLMGDNDETRIRFTRLYLIARDLTEPCYEMLRDKMTMIEGFINSQLEETGQIGDVRVYFEYDHPNKFSVNELDSKERNLVVFDDCVIMLEDKKSRMQMQETFMRGRKKNASLVFISQNPFHQHLKFIRNQCQHFYLFDTGSSMNVNRLADEIGLDKQELQYKTRDAFRVKYGFVSISCDSKRINIGFG